MASPFSDTQLKKFKKSLRETSADYSRGARIEFVSFDDTVYDFDGVTKEVCAKYRYDPCSSCDALYLNNGKYYLIEFKNQGESNIKKDEIKKKAFDSIGILQNTFCWNMNREELKKKLVLAVVYNSKLETRKSFVNFEKKIASLAKVDKEGILFDLKDFKDLYSEIHTVDKSDFENRLYPEIFNS